MNLLTLRGVSFFRRVTNVFRPISLRNACAMLAIAAVMQSWAGAQTAVTTVGVGTTPKAAVVNPVTNKVYVANSGSASVTVIDEATMTPSSVSVGVNPTALAVNPATNKIYVANQTDGTITVINAANSNSTATVTVGSSPDAVAVNPSTNRIYVANSGSGSVSVINGATDAVVTTVTVGTTPVAIAVNEATNRIYVANSGSGNVSIIDGSNNTVITNATVGGQPSSVAVNAASNKAVVANLAGGISFIDSANVVTTVVANASSAVTFNPVTNKAYAANTSGVSITLADATANTAGSITGGPATTHSTAIAVDPETNLVYVANGGGAQGRLTVLNAANSNLIVGFIPTGLGPSALALNPVTHRLFVVNQTDNNVTVVDCRTNANSTITMGASPIAVGVNPVTNKIYVANAGDGTVTVVNGANNTAGATPVTVGTTPDALEVNPITNRIYVANQSDGTVSVINGSTDAVVATVTVGQLPEALAVNPVTNRAYVANTLDGTVSVIDGTTNIATVTVGSNPQAISVNPATNKIYVANFGSASVTVINGLTNATTTVSTGGSPHAIAVNQATNEIYVANETGTVTVIDGSTDTASATPITAGNLPFAIAANPISNKIYVTNLNGGDVMVIDGASKTVAATVTAGLKPGAVAVNPVSGKVYVVNRGDQINNGTITVIDGATDAALGTAIPAGVFATPIAINPITNNVYVVGESSNDLLAISELPLQANPLSTTITPLAGNTTASATPSFQFSATSTFSPTAPTPTGVYFQFDSWQGPWLAAGSAGAGFSGTAPVLSSGTHVLYAFAVDGQHGTSSNSGVNSNPFTGTISAYLFSETATGNATTTTLSSSVNPSNAGQSVTFTATVSSIAGTPTGIVTFFDGSTSLGSTALVSGQATLATAALSAGSHSITAAYSGDATFGASVSAVLTQTVNGLASSTGLTSSLNPSNFGDSVTFTATVTGSGSPGGTVKFLDGSTSIGTGTLNGLGQATLTISTLSAATHNITAAYQGDATFNPSTSAVLQQTVNGDPTSTGLTAAPNPSTFGQSVTFTATVTSGAGTPSGTVNFFDGPASIGTGTLSAGGVATLTVADLSAAVHSITATYNGNATFAGSGSAALNQTVNPAGTTTAVASSANPASVGQSVTFTASVTSTGGTPTGAVLFFDGATQIGSGTLDAAGQATFATTSLAVGSHSIAAQYQSDGNFASSSSAALTQTINSASATTTTLASSANPSGFAQSITLTATVSSTAGTPTGVVNFFDGAASIGNGTLAAGKATLTTSLLSVGSHSITAQYAGTASFSTSTSAVLAQSVVPATTTTTVSASANPVNAGVSVTFTATVGSTVGTPSGNVSFLDGTANLGAATLDITGHATLSTSALTAGSHSITAKYSGSTNFSVSTSTALNETVNTPPPPDFTVGPSTPGATTATVKAGQQANYSLALALAGGATGSLDVTITCSGAPAKATCVVPAGPVVVSGSVPTNFTVSVTTTANAGLLPVGSSQPRQPLNMMPLLGMLAIASLLVWGLANKNSRTGWAHAFQARRFVPALPALALLFIVATVVGCGGGGGGGPIPNPTPTPTPTATGTPAGTYTLTITTATATNTHVQQLTLTVQ